MRSSQSKHHTGRCDFVFDKWTKGKCSKCGFHKEWKVRCAFPVCNKTFKMGHICGKDPMTSIYGH
jgi:hypothetical protein